MVKKKEGEDGEENNKWLWIFMSGLFIFGVGLVDTALSDGSNIWAANITNIYINTSHLNATFGVINQNITIGNRSLIINNGKMGIGTNSPGALLDVRGDAIFNEDGDDNDFRIEGDTEQNLFFVDASTDRVAIGRNNPQAPFDMAGDEQNHNLYVTNLAASSTNNTAQFFFRMQTSTTERNIIGMTGKLLDTTDATRTGSMRFLVQNNGNFGTRLAIEGNQIGIGTTAPADALQIDTTQGGLTINSTGFASIKFSRGDAATTAATLRYETDNVLEWGTGTPADGIDNYVIQDENANVAIDIVDLGSVFNITIGGDLISVNKGINALNFDQTGAYNDNTNEALWDFNTSGASSGYQIGRYRIMDSDAWGSGEDDGSLLQLIHSGTVDPGCDDCSVLDIVEGDNDELAIAVRQTEKGTVNFAVKPDGSVGIGISSPSALLDIDEGTGRGIIEIDGSTGGCLKIRDTDDAGFTYCTALNGLLSCGTGAC